MKRFFLLAAAALLVLIVLALHFRIQPSGHARVIRRGDALRVVTSRVAWAPVYLGEGCVVPAEDGSLVFAEELEVRTAAGEPFVVDTSVRYGAPETVPASWPEGTWCESLRAAVRERAAAWAAAVPRRDLLLDPRAAGWTGTEQLTAALSEAGLRIAGASLRPRIPEDLLSTAPIPAIEAAAVDHPPVILLALDGADWEYLDHLIESGAMPNLARLAREGARGVAQTEHPALSPILWTTMMTGVSPLEHGILDFTRFHPTSRTKEPITSDERKVPAVWNMLTDAGKEVAVFGIWATYPAEPVHGTIVSDRFFTFLYQEDELPPGVVWPKFREPLARKILAEVEQETAYDDLKAYLPWLSEAEYRQHATT
ncbi:MAG: alkaline phosphatase family protein, partial [Thermoanaerobaculia bacterium]